MTRSRIQHGTEPTERQFRLQDEDEIKNWISRLIRTFSVKPDEETQRKILEAAFTLRKKHSEWEIWIEDLLKWVVKESKTDLMIRPTTFSFTMVLNALAHSQREDAYQKVEQLVKRLEDLHDEGWPNLQPNVVAYNILLKAMARSGQVDRATEILHYMIESDSNQHLYPDQTSFATLLSAYVKSNDKDIMVKAEMLLDVMETLHESNVPSSAERNDTLSTIGNVKPNTFVYTSLINGWARRGNADRAEKVFHRLISRYLESKDPDLRPDVVAFNNVLLAWVRSRNPERADGFLRSMLSDAKLHVRPNLQSFNTVLAGWAKVGAVDEAEALLTSMHNSSKDGSLNVLPDIISYNTCLDAWSKASRHREDAWKRSEALLRHIEKLHCADPENRLKPNVRTWNTVIDCVAKAGKTIRAEKLLKDFVAASKSGRVDGVPNIRTWNTVIGACLKRGESDRAEDILYQIDNLPRERKVDPDIVTYNTVLQSYVRSNHPRAGEKAEAIFRRLQEDRNVCPNQVSYLTLINAWTNSSRPEKAEEIVLGLCQKAVEDSGSPHNVEVTRDMFHKILSSWSKLGDPKKAEELLFKMVYYYNNSGMDIKPTVETYNRVLHCWSLSKTTEAGERADLILRQMEDLASSGDKASTPDVVSYNTVLNAWANSGDPTAVTMAEHLVLEMILKGDPKVTPTEVTYGTWLKIIEAGTLGDKGRQAKEVLRTMAIHNFDPTPFISKKIDELCSHKYKQGRNVVQ